MTARKGLLSALKNRDINGLIQCTKELSATNALSECVNEVSHRQLAELWDIVQSMFVEALRDTDMDCKKTSELLHCVTKLADATIKIAEGGEVVIPPSSIEVAILVHGIFPTLTLEHSVLKDDISRLFERWWTARVHGREELMGNTILYLLDKSTGPKSTKADVARVYSVCRVLESINLSCDSACILVDLLLSSCVHPQFLESNQGIKFLAYLLTLNSDLTEKLHQTVKNHLPATPSSWHTKFSEVYFRAWQEVKTPHMKEVIEHKCIQDLMYRAIHARRGGQHSMAKTLFRVLSFIHKKKTQKGVESMLLQLYEPILWRSLMVANSDVQINAASLMFDIFPLQDTNLNREQADAALQKQFDIMHSLLSDPVPEVRLTAVNGVGKVLNIYWELIPADVIKCFVRKLVEDLAYDISSPAVREAVVKAMIQLCDNHLCVPMLQTILPQLQNFVHDSSEKVRIAMFDLLLKVKGLRAIKFWNLVSVEHILARLQLDSAPVVKRIMKLIQPSFVPLHESANDQVNRCLTLIGLNMAAARQFFLNLRHCISFADVVKYIILLCRTLIVGARKLREKNHAEQSTNVDDDNDTETSSDDSAVAKETNKTKCSSKPQKKIRKTDSITSGDEEDSDEESAPRRGDEFLGDMKTFCGLVEAVYLIHTVILDELADANNKEIKEGLAKKLGIMVREVMTISQDPRLDEALIALASHLPSRALPHFAQKLFSRLTNTSSISERMDMKLITKSLVLWGKTESVIQLVKESLESLFQNKNLASERRSRQLKKSVAFVAEEKKIDPKLACTLIVNMITPAECRLILLTSHRRSLLSLVDLLRSVETRLQSYFTKTASLTQNEMKLYLDLYVTLLRLTAFLCSSCEPVDGSGEENVDDNTQLISRTISWSCRCVVSHLNDEDKDRRVLSTAIVESVIKMCTNLMMIGLAQWAFLKASVKLFKEALEVPNAAFDLKSCVLRGVYQVVQVCRYCKNILKDDRTTVLDDLGYFSLDCVLKSLAELAVVNDENGKDCTDDSKEPDSQPVKNSSSLACQAVMSKVVEIILQLMLIEMSSDMTVKLVDSVLDFIFLETQAPNQEKELPPLTASLLTVFKKQDRLKKIFLQQLQNFLCSDKVNKMFQVRRIMGICKVLITDSYEPVSCAIYRSLKSALDVISISDSNRRMFEEMKTQIEDQLRKIAAADVIETAS